MDSFTSDVKEELDVLHGELENDPNLEQIHDGNYDPLPDKRDMRRLGRRQQFKRRFRFYSLIGYMVILGATWEGALITAVFALNNGGKGGAIWITLAACLGQLSSTVSMAEMASISPTAGGQYHWISEFAPPNYQKPLSYAVGWLCALGWQTAMPGIAYVAGLQIISLIATCAPDFVAKNWQFALLMIAFVSFAILFNMVAINQLPLIEIVVVVIHLFGFFALVAVFWALGPRTPGFFAFTDVNGWGSTGLATLVSLVGPSAALIGADAAVHLAEELQNASYVLPRAMVSSACINYITSFIMVISFVSAIGASDLEEILTSNTGQPWVAVIRSITRSKGGTIVLGCLVAFQFTFTSINQVTTSSRQLWAFARDKGVPFHASLSKVSAKDGVPRNAIIVTLCTTIIIACIIIGSTIAFNNLLSITNVSLVISYIFCIGTLVSRRLRNEPLPPSRFSLGRYGIWINCIALAWLSVLAVFLFFPAAPNPDAASMNWACLIFGAVVGFAFVWYFVRGRKDFTGPVVLIQKDV